MLFGDHDLLVDPDVFHEKTQVLLLVIRKLNCLVTSGGNKNISFTFKKLVSHECSYCDAACTTSVSEDFVASVSMF